MVCGLSHTFWELLSMLTLTLVGVFVLIDRISTQRFPMTKLLSVFLIISATFIAWVKLELVVPAYRLDGVVDLILGMVMSLVAVHFLTLVLRVSHSAMPCTIERWSLITVCIVWVVGALYLFMAGSQAQFAELDAWVNTFLRPFWIVALIVLLVRSKPGASA